MTVKLDNGTNSGGKFSTVKRRTTDANGFSIGRTHNNPLMDTIEYKVELEYGTTYSCFDNSIAENVYSRLDSEGHQTLVMIDIIDHLKDGSEVTRDNVFTGNHSNIPKKTMKVWEALI